MKFPRKVQRYGLEFLTVFLGVSLSLLAENWRQRRAETSAQHNSLAQLYSDLAAEETDMTTNLDNARKGLQAARYLVAGVRGHDPDSISDALTNLGQCSFFIPYTSEYTALKSSGRLTIIEEASLRQQVVAFYEYDPFVQWLHERDCILTGELMDSMLGRLEFAESGSARRDSIATANFDSLRARNFVGNGRGRGRGGDTLTTRQRDSVTALFRRDSAARAQRRDSVAQADSARDNASGPTRARGGRGRPSSRYPRIIFRDGQDAVLSDPVFRDRVVRLATQRSYLINQLQNRITVLAGLRATIKTHLGSDTLVTNTRGGPGPRQGPRSAGGVGGTSRGN